MRKPPKWFVREVLLPFAFTRLLLILVAWGGFHLVEKPFRTGEWEIGSNGMVSPIQAQLSSDVHPVLNMFSRWDGAWYLSIAQHGYRFTPGKESNVAFFPLYPGAVRVLHFAFPFHSDAGWLFLGILLSNGACLLALAWLYQLVFLDYGESVAAHTVLYLCVFPTTLFLSAFYSEGLFLACVLGAFFFARRGRWLWAGVFAGLAAIGRAPGVLVVIALACEYLQQKKFNWREIKADCLSLLLAPLALAAHLAYFKWRFDDWFVIFKVESVQSWSRKLTPPWVTFATFFQRPHAGKGTHDSYLDLLFTLLLIGLTIFVALRLRLSYAVYAVTTVIFITSWGYLTSIPRFGVVIFPVMIALALLGRNESFHRAYLFISSAIAAYCMFTFSHWGWLG